MNRLIDSEKHAEYPATRTVVRENGMRIPDPEAFDRPNLSDGVAFGLCLRGGFRFRIDYREHCVSAGQLFVVLPRHLFTPISGSEESDVRILTVPLDKIHRSSLIPDFDLLRRTEARPCLTPDGEQLKRIAAVWELLAPYESGGGRAAQIREALTSALLLIVTSLVEEQPPQGGEGPVTRQEQLTQDFFSLLLEYHGRQHGVAFYADRLCISAKYLSSVVKSVTGYAPHTWINEAVVMQAKREIRTTDRSIQQIAESLHFATSTSFVRFFRQHTGSTPLDYRKNGVPRAVILPDRNGR